MKSVKKEKIFNYKAFGLSIKSEMEIPELEESVGKKSTGNEENVPIVFGKMRDAVERYERNTLLKKKNNEFVYHAEGVGGIRVSNEKIVVLPESDLKKGGFRFLVSGFGLGLLLHLRGYTTIHASAVVLQSGVVAFVGQKGMGKSTTAAALNAHGHPVFTDDLLVLNTSGDGIIAYPGFPYLKLTPDSIIASVEEDPSDVPQIDPGGPKHSFAAQGDCGIDPLPVGCIYVLDYHEESMEGAKSDMPRSEELRGQEAIIELVRNSYISRLLPEEGISNAHLQRTAEIARSTSMRRLYRKFSLEHLHDVVAQVEEDQECDLSRDSRV